MTAEEIDDACSKEYSKNYSDGEYCHEQSFRWGFQEGVRFIENNQKRQRYMKSVEEKIRERTRHILPNQIYSGREVVEYIIRYAQEILDEEMNKEN